MSTAGVIILVAVIAVAAIAIFGLMRRRTEHLKERFGPEYNRAVEQSGNKYRAEAKLEKLEKQVKGFSIHALTAEQAARFREKWRSLQGMFVDDPNRALREADVLVADVMKTRGYPLSDFENQAAQLSVDHASVVEHYRAGHRVVLHQDQASTEDVRQALIHYRSLFDELVGAEQARSARA